jgi:hypothetical protein
MSFTNNNRIIMNWEEALQSVVSQTKVKRYEFLCSEEHKEYAWWREEMIRMANGEHVKPNISTSSNVVVKGRGTSMYVVPSSEGSMLMSEMKACPNYLKDSGCGCGMSRCKAGRKGRPDDKRNDGTTLVSVWDCWHCLRPDNPKYAERAYRPIA